MPENVSRLVRPRTVTGRGEGLVSHAGLVWLGATADAVGLTAGLSAAMRGLARRRHDPGRTMAQVVLALADGATCLSDLAVLRDQPALFGPVASHPTAWRTFNQAASVELRNLDRAVATARARAWDQGAGPEPGALTVIDLDATLLTTRADKQDAAPTYKRTYGHHPLMAMCPQTSEILASRLRPGNAGSNTASDHVIVLADAIAALPPAWQAGHHPGNDPALVQQPILVRADAAGATHWFAEECADRNLLFSFGYQITAQVRDALALVDEQQWRNAKNRRGARQGAWVIELTDHMDMTPWPPGTRLICRRERPHPGAQLSLFDTIEGLRHTCFLTNQTDPDIAATELRHRQRGTAEQVIRDAKACGLENLPFDEIVSNDLWHRLVATATNLLAWARRLTLPGPLRNATPKTLRYRLLHIAGRITTNRLDLDSHWPWTTTLTNAIDRLHTLFPPPKVTGPHAL